MTGTFLKTTAVAALALTSVSTAFARHAPAQDGAAPAMQVPAGPLHAELLNGEGAAVGTALVEQVEEGVRVTVAVTGIPAGPHGAHVHTVGRCEAPGFTSAGGHWNPGGTQHGLENPAGPHAGDMPNLVVADDGTGAFSFILSGGSFAALMDADGAAVVIHAGPDDMHSDPAGNSGGRIACGVLTAQ